VGLVVALILWQLQFVHWSKPEVNGMSNAERMEFIELSELPSSRATT
jgi:hypothetical protein